ncbi:MAG: hypothetical protein P1P81_09240 [Desulfobulbales bacterium]|nr:hypothetical protein [Desulfobulbales bacterium]
MRNKQWDYGGHYRNLDLSGEISLPHDSVVKVCDWLEELPDFMLQADTLFIDPPWNKGNVNTFYTKAGKAHISLDFLEFSRRLFEKIDHINPDFLFIEMGKQYLGWYLEQASARYRYVTFYNSTYYRRPANKCYVIHAANQFKLKRYPHLEDQDEAAIIAWLCANHPYKCIGDLCMGQGLVGKHAFLAGRRFVGTELNHKRLAVLISDILQAEESGGNGTVNQ